VRVADPRLRLVREPALPAHRARSVAAIAAFLLAAGATGVGSGASEARRPLDARAVAREAIERSLEAGSADPEVRAALARMRAALERRPLDSRARVAYAGLLLGLAGSLDDLAAPVWHARQAVRLAPVTVPVVSPATLVLARAGRTDEALALARAMFEYDLDGAVRVLGRLEPFVAPDGARAGLADAPEAWLAWAAHLRGADRPGDADLWLAATHERWPGDVTAIRMLAARAVARGDFDELARLVDGVEPPAERAHAALWVYRARLAIARGDAAAAASDLEVATDLAGDAPPVLAVVADGWERLGRAERAREAWTRALFELGGRAPSTAAGLHARLARLEESEGRAGAALRHWREALALDPEHAEARRSVGRLSGRTP